MAGTNAILVKTALVTLFRTVCAPVMVDDAYKPRTMEREYVYFGHITIEQEPMVFRSGIRQPRQEMLSLPIHVEVSKPAATTLDTDNRATEIGTLLEDALAADPTQAALSVPGLLAAWMSTGSVTSFYVDGGTAMSEIIYTVTAQSKLG